MNTIYSAKFSNDTECFGFIDIMKVHTDIMCDLFHKLFGCWKG